jgi:hypothetical protein
MSAELIESVPDTRFHIPQYGMIQCTYALHCFEQKIEPGGELTPLRDAGNLTPKLTPTLMNSDDKDERKSSVETRKGNDSEHGIREKHTSDAPG